MKTSRKPDLLLLLAIFVLIGVIVSTLSQLGMEATNSIQEKNATTPIRTQNHSEHELYRVNYQRISSQLKQAALASRM